MVSRASDLAEDSSDAILIGRSLEACGDLSETADVTLDSCLSAHYQLKCSAANTSREELP